MPFHNHTLANGLRIIGESSPSARSAALGFFVRTGARDETPDESGVTHFLEHMVFKGTPRRTYLDVNRDFDRIGADNNAWTSEENTVFHAAVLPEYIPQAIDVLADILRPSLRQEDFDMEKNVIIQEIGRHEDQPANAACEHAKRLFFGDHRLAGPVLGTVPSITALTREQMQAYFDRRYVAPNITVVAAGRFDWPALVELIDRSCGGWKSGPVGREGLNEAKGADRLEVIVREKVAQEYVILMAPGPAADSPLRHSADLLAMAVGDDSGSRLYWELVDPGLADAASASFHEYEGAGSFFTFVSGEPDVAQSNLEVVFEVLRAVQRDGVQEEELNQARSKMLSRVVRGNERPMGRMGSLGQHWLYQHQYRSVDDELKAYEAVTLQSIREVLDRYPLDRVAVLALGPLERLERP